MLSKERHQTATGPNELKEIERSDPSISIDNPFLAGETEDKCASLEGEMKRAICEGRDLGELAEIAEEETLKQSLRTAKAERMSEFSGQQADSIESAADVAEEANRRIEAAANNSQTLVPKFENPFLIDETADDCAASDSEMDRAVCEGRTLEELAELSERDLEEQRLQTTESAARLEESERRADAVEAQADAVEKIADALEKAAQD